MTRVSAWVALVCLVGLAGSPRAAAGEGLFAFINSREFDVSIAPVDEASRNADNSILYQRDEANGEWRALGPCKRVVRENGDIRFTRTVGVGRDGTYHYTSRPVVGGDVENPPERGDAPQASVVVDTLPPIARIVTPGEEFTTKPGAEVTVSWQAEDEHLTDRPVAVSYSGDGGRSWNVVQRDLRPEGDFQWKMPDDLIGPALLRVAAVDKAGNIGRSLRSLESIAPPKPKPVPVQAKAPLEKIPEVKPEPVQSTALPEPAPAKRETVEAESQSDPNASWLYYLMALNLMRQNKPADALQYYWLSVKEDPEFINAWADIALAYTDLGAYRTAREVAERARGLAPDRVDLMHLLGETYHAEGMELLTGARSPDDRVNAKAFINQAVAWYGKAVDTAAKEWKLAEQAASFYRLGEICYYVNLDPEGARAYWEKILKLHIPKPNPDLMQWSASRDKSFERRRYERNTDQWVTLHTWQNWARGYLEQMNERERRGIVELMKAQRIHQARARASQVQSLDYAGNEMNPGRDDGRSLFSLPAVLGSPDDVAACVGTAGGTEYVVYGNGQGSGAGQTSGRVGAGIGGMNEINFPAHMNRDALTAGYSFYSNGERPPNTYGPCGPAGQPGGQGARPGRGLLSGMPEPQGCAPIDPYGFPAGGQPGAPWNSAQPYGNRPLR